MTAPTRVPFRIDAGIMPSPVGLFTLDLQPHRNPLISAPFYYFSPLPATDGGARPRLISGGYPVGGTISTSGSWWDARAGVTDSSPAMPRYVFDREAPGAHPQLIVGGGVTPITGLRIGLGLARGRFGSSAIQESGVGSPAPRVGVQRRRGVRVRLHPARRRVGPQPVRHAARNRRGARLQRTGRPDPDPTASRLTRVTSPVATVPADLRRSSASFEATLGYRLTPELTVRSGYQRDRGFKDTGWSNAAVMSLVWADRWW